MNSDKVLRILEFLSLNTGVPISSNEIATGCQLAPTTINDVLKKLQLQGLIYPVKGFWYVTMFGKEAIQDPTKLENVSNQISNLRQQYKSVNVDNRDKTQEHTENWKSLILKVLPHFQINHPEYNDFYKYLKSNPHGYSEFLKDVQALFLKWEMTHPSLAYEKETEYVYPQIFESVEQAINESIQRFIKYYTEMSSKMSVPTQVSYKNALGLLNSVLQSGEGLKNLISNTHTGSVLSQQDIHNFINSLKLNKNKSLANVPAGVLEVSVISYLQSSNLPQSGIFLESTPINVIVDSLYSLSQSSKSCRNLIISYWGSEGDGEKKVSVISNLFSNHDWSNKDLHEIILSNTTIKGANFSNSNLDQIVVNKTSIQNCGFHNASMKGVDLKVSDSFTNNNIDQTNFTNSTVPSGFLKSNKGNPIGSSISESIIYTDNTPEYLKTSTLSSFAFPLPVNDMNDAIIIAKALQDIVYEEWPKQHRISSLKLPFIPLKTQSSLSQNEIQELRKMIDTGEAPNINYGKDLMKWLVEKNKNQELQQAGFNKLDVNTLFGKARNLQGGNVDKKEERARERDLEKEKENRKISLIVEKFRQTGKILTKDLLSILENKESLIAKWLMGAGEELSLQDAQTLLTSLVTSIKGLHTNNFVKPTGYYRPFPFRAKMDDIKDTQHTLYGNSEKQFGMILIPNYNQLPSDVARLTHFFIQHGGTHLYGALSHVVITPRKNTSVNFKKRKEEDKLVWVIGEMQSDSYQKSSDEKKSAESKFGKGAVEAFRETFRDWPMNMMNAIIDAAGKNGVDEVWMPPAKVINARRDWDKYYDDAAKKFGGTLQKVGTRISANPYSSANSFLSDQFYIIPIPKKQLTSSLKLSWQKPQNVDEIVNKLVESLNYALQSGTPDDSIPETIDFYGPRVQVGDYICESIIEMYEGDEERFFMLEILNNDDDEDLIEKFEGDSWSIGKNQITFGSSYEKVIPEGIILVIKQFVEFLLSHPKNQNSLKLSWKKEEPLKRIVVTKDNKKELKKITGFNFRIGTIVYINSNNELHNPYGPAVEKPDGTKWWFINGKHHRLDGPAEEYSSGERYWWVNGEFTAYNQEKFEEWKREHNITSNLKLSWKTKFPVTQSLVNSTNIIGWDAYRYDVLEGKVLVVGPAKSLIKYDETGSLQDAIDEEYMTPDELSVAVAVDPNDSMERYEKIVWSANEIEVTPSIEETTSSLKLPYQTLKVYSEYDWERIKDDLVHHFRFVIDHNRENFPDVQQYATDDMIGQFAWNTFFTEYHISQQWVRDPEFVSKCLDIVKDELNITIMPQPFIDWLYWLQKAWDDVRWFIKNQKEISPDLNTSNQELARDWMSLWKQEQIPMDIKLSSWYKSLFLPTIGKMLEDKGLGDVFSESYLPPPPSDINNILNPPDKDEGEKEFVDREGNPIREEEQPENKGVKLPSFDVDEIEKERQRLMDGYLDDLNEAMRKGDTQKVQKLKDWLHELNSSLKLSWQKESQKIVTTEDNVNEINRRTGFDLEVDTIIYLNSNNELHNLNGPAVEFPSGSKYWYQNGKCHRIDGPAVILSNGRKRWYIDGKYLGGEPKFTQEDFEEYKRSHNITSSLKFSWNFFRRNNMNDVKGTREILNLYKKPYIFHKPDEGWVQDQAVPQSIVRRLFPNLNIPFYQASNNENVCILNDILSLQGSESSLKLKSIL